MKDIVKKSNNGAGEHMWQALTWTEFDNKTIYCSTWMWKSYRAEDQLLEEHLQKPARLNPCGSGESVSLVSMGV